MTPAPVRPTTRIGKLLPSFMLLLFTQFSFAQLKINDTCPDVKLGKIINYPFKAFSLSDFKGKALIIDFWNTQCLSCLQSFPVVDSLQKKYHDVVQFLFVTKEDEKTVKDFFLNHKKIKVPLTPVVAADKTLTTLFPSEGYPYTVWMDSLRIVKHLTGSYNTTELHLEKFLNGEDQKLKYTAVKTKYAPLWSFNADSFEKKLIYYSCLTPCIGGLDISRPEGDIINKQAVTLSCNCCTIPELIKKAFGEMGRYQVNTNYGIEIRLKDSLNFSQPSDRNTWDTWQEQHTYDYSLVVPAERMNDLYRLMQQDLIRYFHFSAFLVKKKIKSYELYVLDDKKLVPSKAPVPMDPYNDGNINTVRNLEFKDQPIARLAYLLNEWIGYYYPVKNSVGQKLNIDFTIRKSSIELLNIKDLREDLKKSNLDLRESWIENEVWVVEDK